MGITGITFCEKCGGRLKNYEVEVCEICKEEVDYYDKRHKEHTKTRFKKV